MNVALHPDIASRPDTLRYISVCTGGGGLDIGLGLAIPGARAACMVEREAFAAAHMVAAMEKGLMAPAPLWSDARTFDGRRWRGAVDFVIGGIPCQPWSVAGARAGHADGRDLWPDFRHILVQSGAWGCLIENVPGMLSPPKGGGSAPSGAISGAERVWRDLRRLGFVVEGGLFSAEEVGALQCRERVFILAVSDARTMADAVGDRKREPQGGLGDEWRRVADGGGGIGLFPPGPGDFDGWRAIEDAAPELLPARSRYDRFRIALGNEVAFANGDPGAGDGVLAGATRTVRSPGLPPATQSDLRRVAYGMAVRLDDECAWQRVDRLRLLGNGVHPLQAGYAVRTLGARLAGRSRAADKFVRMMEVGE